MPTLSDFIDPVSRYSAPRVVGCYLSPRVLLTEPDWEDPISPLRIAWRIQIPEPEEEVLVTVSSGLFVEPPEELRMEQENPSLDDLNAKLDFEERVARALNMVVCELTLRGVVSEPAAPAFISRGTLIDDHVAILGGGGGREAYFDRHIDILGDLQARRWIMLPPRGVDVLDDAATLLWASKVTELSPHAPTLVAGAYSNFSRMQHAEALADAWIVIEQFIDRLWKTYVDDPSNSDRRQPLSDTRTYSAAVRLEVLGAAGHINADLRTQIDLARSHRNKLHHRAKVSREAAGEVLDALWRVLKELCGPVAPPLETRYVNW